MTKATIAIGASFSLHEALDTLSHPGQYSKISRPTRRGCCQASYVATSRETLLRDQPGSLAQLSYAQTQAKGECTVNASEASYRREAYDYTLEEAEHAR
jgi:hypothetical protein